MSNRLIYNLATDTRLNGGSQDFLCFPDQKNEKSVGFKSTNEVCEMMNVDLIFWQSCVVPLCHCAASISRSFSFDQNRRILNIRKGHFLPPILPPTATTLSILWSDLITCLTVPCYRCSSNCFKILFLLWKEKNNWVFLYWKTIFNFGKEDLMWWFWTATSCPGASEQQATSGTSSWPWRFQWSR